MYLSYLLQEAFGSPEREVSHSELVLVALPSASGLVFVERLLHGPANRAVPARRHIFKRRVCGNIVTRVTFNGIVDIATNAALEFCHHDYLLSLLFIPKIGLNSVRPEPFDTLRTSLSKGRSW